MVANGVTIRRPSWGLPWGNTHKCFATIGPYAAHPRDRLLAQVLKQSRSLQSDACYGTLKFPYALKSEI